MKTKIINFWESLKFSFWFVPTLMVLFAIIMAINMITLDRGLEVDPMRFLGFMYSVSPEGARAVLSTIAGSMMTVAGVTFSITIVVLNLASSQFGPRLLRNFMQDKGTQFVLGTFVATFIYCLLVLRSVQTFGTDTFVPNFSITFAIILALFNVGVLIFFIHHIATSIQAEKVVAGISGELELSIKRIFSDELSYDTEDERRRISRLPKEEKDHYYTHHITALRNGYLQAVDMDGLLQNAVDNDYRIELQLRPGQFIVSGSTLAMVISKEIFDVRLIETITDTFIIGDQRTSEQDIEYPIHQLVEVAIRALSPGVNDPYTAISCIDQLCSALCSLAKREFPSPCWVDDQDKICLTTKPLTYQGVVNASFDQIRQYGRTSVAVTIRLLETFIIIIGQTRHSEQRKAIHRQANMVLRASQEKLFESDDIKDVQERYQILINTLNDFDDKEGPYEVSDDLPNS